MLSSVLHVLAVIGIVLLCMIGVLLLLILAVLLLPLRYRISVQKQEGKAFHIRADVNWLAGLVRVRVRLFEPRIVKIKLLFFTVFDPFREKKPVKEKEKRNAAPKKSEEKREPVPPEQKEKKLDKTVPPENTEASEETAQTRTEEKPGKNEEQKTGRGKIYYTIRGICDKIKATKNTTDYYKELLQSEECRSVFHQLSGKLGRLLRHVLPRRLNGGLLFGTGQPDQTGYILGVISIIRGIRGYDKFQLEADFERQILEGSLQCKGRIRLAVIGILVLQIYTNRELREFISRWKREEK